jgi:acyl dehydratase
MWTKETIEMPGIYFVEDEIRDLGSCTLPKDEMVEFARRFDPQLIYIEEEVAHDSMYEGLIASG